MSQIPAFKEFPMMPREPDGDPWRAVEKKVAMVTRRLRGEGSQLKPGVRAGQDTSLPQLLIRCFPLARA